MMGALHPGTGGQAAAFGDTTPTNLALGAPVRRRRPRADRSLTRLLDPEKGFSPALADVLRLHKAYRAMDEERAADIDGSLALRPLVVAYLAYDGGFAIDVESEYLTKQLLQLG